MQILIYSAMDYSLLLIIWLRRLEEPENGAAMFDPNAVIFVSLFIKLNKN